MSDDVLISTMNDVPGYEVVQVHGEVYGLIVRARNVFSNIGAGLRTIVGGEARGYTKLLMDSRDQATERLREAAAARGANAVLAMRFDCNEIAQTMSEVAAYGTAVYIVPNDQPAQQHAAQQHQPQAQPQQQYQQAPPQQMQQPQR